MDDSSEMLHMPREGASLVLSETRASLVARARKDAAGLMLRGEEPEFLTIIGSENKSLNTATCDADALFKIGLKYYDGDGVAYDHALASFWFSKAADQDHTAAQYYLGMLFDIERDHISATVWFQKAANRGYIRAQYRLGLQYGWGHGVPQDATESAIWCHRAAHQGYRPAQYMLGALYANGNGVSKDYTQSAFWYRKAADQGHFDAQQHIGLLYYEGEYVERDYAEAFFWLDIRCRRGGSYDNICGDRSIAAAKKLTAGQRVEVLRRIDQWLAAHSLDEERKVRYEDKW